MNESNNNTSILLINKNYVIYDNSIINESTNLISNTCSLITNISIIEENNNYSLSINYEQELKEIMIHIYCDIKDINYLLSDNIDIKHISNIIFNLSKKCEYFNEQMFNEKVNELFIIETVIMIKNYKKELLIKNTKLFNILILNIFSLFNETS